MLQGQRMHLALCLAALLQISTVISVSNDETKSILDNDETPAVVSSETFLEQGNLFGDSDSAAYDDLPDDNKNNKNTLNKKDYSDSHTLYSDELIPDGYDDLFNINFKQNSQQEDHEWDLLIFTQQWPVTTCYHWREEDKTHSCTLPQKKEFWTIHGIWPTKLGHFGPNFCNKTADFNLDQLKTIINTLEQFWPDIDGDSQEDWLWKHEWLKHGTCAALLEELNNELKYFGKGLMWREKYSMSSILASSGIHPDSNNTVIALQTALVKGLGGKNPSIHCLYDNKNDVSYLSEIRICFNKSFELTDCNGVKRGDAVHVDYPGGTVITNCRISKAVHYPSLVPPLQRQNNVEKWKFPVVNMYKLLQFIMWFTL